MKNINYITTLLFVMLLFFISFKTASAQVCFINPNGSGEWAYCEPNPLYPGSGEPLRHDRKITFRFYGVAYAG